MTERPTPTISIITATYNAAEHLPRLIESLAAQTDQDFEWVVADGGSTDGTLEILETAKLQLNNVVVDSRPDFGIYDALNRGVKKSKSDFYVVLGADDELLPQAVNVFKKECNKENTDLISFKFHVDDRISNIREPRWEFLFSQSAHVTGHAVGLLIRKSLHEKNGYYSRILPIAADQLFILSSIRNGAKVSESNSIVGRFSIEGVSNTDPVGALTEIFRVNVLLGHNYYIQLLILILRLIKNKK